MGSQTAKGFRQGFRQGFSSRALDGDLSTRSRSAAVTTMSLKQRLVALCVFFFVLSVVESENSLNYTENSHIETSMTHLEKLKYRYNLHTTKKQGAVKGVNLHIHTLTCSLAHLSTSL